MMWQLFTSSFQMIELRFNLFISSLKITFTGFLASIYCFLVIQPPMVPMGPKTR